MARQNKISHRYAKAIFDYLGKNAEVREMVESLEKFAGVVASSSELRLVLHTNVFSEEQREGIVEDLVKKMKLGADARKVLLILSQSNRLDQVSGVVDQLRALLFESEDVVPLQVESAAKLESDEKKTVEKEFSEILGKKVEAAYVVEPSVLGGLRVTAGGRSYTGTLSGWLETFQERLSGG